MKNQGDAQPGQAGVALPWNHTSVIGNSVPRVDAYERVTGTALYTLDMQLPDMLHAAVVRCPFANAIVKRIVHSEVMGMPGVRALLSSSDPEGQLVLPYPWWVAVGPPMHLFETRCRYAGEEVIAVAAETATQAWEAARAIEVEYEELPFLLDHEQALAPNVPRVHDKGNLVRPESVYKRGNVAEGFAAADAVAEETYRTSCLIHTPLEVHASVAVWDGNRVTVWDGNQAVFNEQRYLATALNLPLSAVRVISHYVGGSFGSKAELSKHTLIAVVLARKTGRPVKCALTREESFLCVGNRPANTMFVKAGIKSDGSLTALHLRNAGSVGAYADWADVAGPVAGLYTCANVLIEETEVFVHAGKSRAFRAPGEAQGTWALEQMMDTLAEKISMDPIAVRLKNIAIASQASGRPYTSSGYRECLLEGARAFGWENARSGAKRAGVIRRGVGMAGAFWNTEGGPPTTVLVSLLADGSANLNMALVDIGTGTKSVMAMIVSEELGIPLEKIHIEDADTGATQFGKPTGGSHAVVVYAPAVRQAALDVKRQLLELAGKELQVEVSMLALKDGRVIVAGGQSKKITELKALQELEQIIGIGRPQPDPPGKLVMSFAAQFAEVEVNTKTGEIQVLRLVAAHDSGRVMNRLTYESQVFGGMAMAVGFALTECRIMDRNQTGRMVNTNWHDYKIPTAKDVPFDQICLPIDPQDRECNSVGAKGLGEIGTIPTAPAIANAIYHATGVRMPDSPITPMRMLRSLAANRSQGK